MSEAIVQDQSEAGFSQRFNVLLDHAGFPQRGRDLQVGARFDRSKAGARKWLKDDVVPRNLREIVEELIKEIDESMRIGPLIQWLEHGKEAYNPFKPSTYADINHLLLNAIYLAVDRTARDLEIPIQKLPQSRINHIYDTVLRTCARYRCETPDEELIRDLLLLAGNKQ